MEMKGLRPQNSRSGFMTDVLTGLNPSMNVNGSITPVEYQFRPPVGEAWILNEMFVQILTNTININDTEFGDVGALTNGIEAKIINDSGIILDYTELGNLKSNNDLSALGFETSRQNYEQKPKSLTGLFKFDGRHHTGLLLDGSKTERFIVIVNDNLTTLLQITIFIDAILQIN